MCPVLDLQPVPHDCLEPLQCKVLSSCVCVCVFVFYRGLRLPERFYLLARNTRILQMDSTAWKERLGNFRQATSCKTNLTEIPRTVDFSATRAASPGAFDSHSLPPAVCSSDVLFPTEAASLWKHSLLIGTKRTANCTSESPPAVKVKHQLN